MADRSSSSITDYIVRGILVGGAVGVFGGLLLDKSLFWYTGLGMIIGFLGGLTFAKRMQKKGD